jgi:uncharacterized membrane protein
LGVWLHWPGKGALASDAFFVAYLGACAALAASLTPKELARDASIADEGGFIVTLLALSAVGYTSFAIFVALNGKNNLPPSVLAFTLAGAPLSWFMLQTVMAFHYARLYYRGSGRKGYAAPVDFPGCDTPGIWEFAYLATVIGMTAQVSDTDIRSTAFRRAVTVHSVVSFFFTTVLIAMAVNAAVSAAG